MASNVTAKSVDVNFSSGLRQDLEGKIAPLGALTTADNVEFDQLNRLVRRDGFVSIGTSNLSKGFALSGIVRRVAQGAAGERMLFTDFNNFVYYPTQNKTSQAGISLRQDFCRAVLSDNLGVAASEVGTITFSDACCVNGYVVYAYTATDPTSGNPTLYVDAIDTATNARVLSGLSFGTMLGTCQPRCVVSGGSSVAFVLFADAANSIKYIKFDFTGTSVSVGLATALVTDAEAVPVFDVDTMTSGWVLCYGQFSAGTHKARVATFSSTPAQTNTFTWLDNGGASNWTPTVLAVCGDSQASATNVMAAGYDGVTFKLETVYLTNALAAPTYKNIDPGLSHTKHAKVMAIGRQDATTWTVAFSNYTSSPLTSNPRGHLYIYTCSASITPATQGTFANYTLASKFYREPGSATLLGAARFDDPSGLQNHLLLLDYGASAYGFPAPVAHWASGRIQLGSDNALTCVGGVADLGSRKFQIVYPINAGANQISGNMVQATTFYCLSPQRYIATTAQGCILTGGGTPQTFDGQRQVELGFYSYPVIGSGSFTPSAAGGSLAQGLYQYRIVYEWTDAHGNRQQSPASPAVTVDMSSATYVAGTNSVGIVVPALHATRKQQSNFVTDTAAPVRPVIYRTKAGGSTFYRLATAAVNNTATAADDTSITDTFADATIAVNEPLYEKNGGQGLLASTAAPPSIFITTHAQRVWGVDSENPERIWCTRTLSQLTAPAYSASLQILIPGAGRINGLAGQDGKLYALATTGIYLATYGDGPDDTGGGAFPTPQLITIDANCTDPRGVLVATGGIYFVGNDQWGTGIYLIRRGDGSPISIGKRVRTELAAYPICRGAIDRVGKERIEFLFVDSDTAPTKAAIFYYHRDYVDNEGIGQWTVARIGTALECLGLWTDIAVVAQSGATTVGLQTPGAATGDFGATAASVSIATADIRPFGLVGYGEITGVTLLGTMSTADPIKIELSYDSGATWADSTQFLATSETVGAPVLRQFQSPTSKLPSGGSFRVRLTDPTLSGSNPGTTFYHGVSVEALPLGGNARLANAQRA